MFKIVLLATVSSVIVIASFLLNFCDQITQQDILIKDAMISRSIAFERVKQLKRRHVKVIQLFWH